MRQRRRALRDGVRLRKPIAKLNASTADWNAARESISNGDRRGIVASVESILSSHLAIVTRSPETHEYAAHCPAHDDKKPSLSAHITDEGKLLLKCHAGCSQAAVLDAMGLELFRNFPIVAVYSYCNERGEVVFEVCRTVNKEFPVRTPDGRWGIHGAQPVLYRLPELLAGIAKNPGRPVLSCEGEKDTDRCREAGFTATCAKGGASAKWLKSYSEVLRGQNVAILPDNDPPGHRYAEHVASALQGVAATVKVVFLTSLPNHGDVSDFFDAGGTQGQLLKLIDRTPQWTRRSESIALIQPVRIAGSKCTDLENARLFSQRFSSTVRFSHQQNKFFVNDGTRWKSDDLGTAVQLAKEIADSRWESAKESGDSKLFQFAQRTASHRSIQAMLALARSESGIPILPEQLDRDPMRLNCPNGTLDLETGTLHPHDPADLITQLCPTPYDPAAKAPLWVTTLNRIFGGDAALIDFVQRFLGMCLTGDVREQFLTIFYGNGSNGKSLLINTFMKVLGTDYSLKASDDIFVTKWGQTHPTALADLFRKRFAVVTETDDDAKLAEALIKWLTGGDRIRARRMREDFWEFDPTHKLLLCTNHKPQIRGTDHAIWRRIRFVPFTIKFWKPGDPSNAGMSLPKNLRADAQLDRKLLREREGILAWCTQGCREWLKIGAGESESVTEATNVYREEQNVLGRFVSEKCKLDKAVKMKSGHLYNFYQTWCEGSGELPIPQNQFKEKLLNQFSNIEHRRSDGSWYLGIALR